MTQFSHPDDQRSSTLDGNRATVDAINRCFRMQDRVIGAVAVMLCDERHRLLQSCTVSDVPATPGRAEVELLLAVFVRVIGESGGGVVIARGKSRDRIEDVDRVLHQHVLEVCGEQGLPLHGFYLAGPTRIHRLPDPLVEPAKARC